jgi:flavodoxin
MGQIGIVYATKTKHSQKLAEAIGNALHIKAENAAVSSVPRPVDLLFITGGIYGGKSLPELLAYVEKLDVSIVKKVVLVTSSVSTSMRSQSDIRRTLEKKGILIQDEITCPGNFLFVKLGHPNDADVKTAVERAMQISKSI